MTKKWFTRRKIILLVVVIVFVLAVMLLPTINTGQRPSEQLRCYNYLKQIGMAVRIYKLDYESYYPTFSGGDDLKKLFEMEYSPLISCPTSKLPYRYIGHGLKGEHSKNLPVAFDDLEAHKGHINVLYADEHIEWLELRGVNSYEELFRQLSHYEESEKDAYELLLNNAKKLDTQN